MSFLSEGVTVSFACPSDRKMKTLKIGMKSMALSKTVLHHIHL